MNEIKEALTELMAATEANSGYWTERIANAMQRAEAALKISAVPQKPTDSNVCDKCGVPIGEGGDGYDGKCGNCCDKKFVIEK
jgi:hypothetical protein